jgi:hypothetical protein
MKKLLIISLLTLFSLNVFSQDTREYANLETFLIKQTLSSEYNLGSINLNYAKDSTKRELIKEIRNFNFMPNLVDNYDYYQDEFKVADLNNDNKLDIYYSGYLDGASDSYAYVFINTPNGFIKAFQDMPGLFLHSVYKNQKLFGLIYCYEGFHGSGIELCRIGLLSFDSSGNKNVKVLIKYPNLTKIPEQYFDKEIQFTVKNEKYYLRSELGEVNGSFNGEILYTYTKGDKGKAFAEETDETGRIWWFVIMDNGIAGWMSSRFLEKQL